MHYLLLVVFVQGCHSFAVLQHAVTFQLLTKFFFTGLYFGGAQYAKPNIEQRVTWIDPLNW